MQNSIHSIDQELNVINLSIKSYKEDSFESSTEEE